MLSTTTPRRTQVHRLNRVNRVKSRLWTRGRAAWPTVWPGRRSTVVGMLLLSPLRSSPSGDSRALSPSLEPSFQRGRVRYATVSDPTLVRDVSLWLTAAARIADVWVVSGMRPACLAERYLAKLQCDRRDRCPLWPSHPPPLPPLPAIRANGPPALP